MTQQLKVVAPYIPLDWQLPALKSKDRVCLLTGSAGGGKSRTAAEKVHAFCLKYPGATVIALRKAREYASKSVVYAIARAIGDSGAGRAGQDWSSTKSGATVLPYHVTGQAARCGRLQSGRLLLRPKSGQPNRHH